MGRHKIVMTCYECGNSQREFKGIVDRNTRVRCSACGSLAMDASKQARNELATARDVISLTKPKARKRKEKAKPQEGG
jgi:uncharacterized Zn finger protein